MLSLLSRSDGARSQHHKATIKRLVPKFSDYGKIKIYIHDHPSWSDEVVFYFNDLFLEKSFARDSAREIIECNRFR